jgi:hypothetical protein
VNNKPWPSFSSAKNTQDTLINKVKKLYQLGKQQQASKEASPLFTVPNKNKTVHFFSDFQEVTRG